MYKVKMIGRFNPRRTKGTQYVSGASLLYSRAQNALVLRGLRSTRLSYRHGRGSTWAAYNSCEYHITFQRWGLISCSVCGMWILNGFSAGRVSSSHPDRAIRFGKEWVLCARYSCTVISLFCNGHVMVTCRSATLAWLGIGTVDAGSGLGSGLGLGYSVTYVVTCAVAE